MEEGFLNFKDTWIRIDKLIYIDYQEVEYVDYNETSILFGFKNDCWLSKSCTKKEYDKFIKLLRETID